MDENLLNYLNTFKQSNENQENSDKRAQTFNNSKKKGFSAVNFEYLSKQSSGIPNFKNEVGFPTEKNRKNQVFFKKKKHLSKYIYRIFMKLKKRTILSNLIWKNKIILMKIVIIILKRSRQTKKKMKGILFKLFSLKFKSFLLNIDIKKQKKLKQRF